jgi:hypothetical protein
MPPRTSRALFTRLVLLLALLCLAACQPSGNPNPRATGLQPTTEAATRPIDAAYVLRDRLLARDGAGFARLAVPPALHAQLELAWRQGRSRWPLDELPLDARIPRMLAALQTPNADKALLATFRSQFAGADADIDQAIRTLMVFGNEYVQTDPDYSPAERDHTRQALTAIGAWALKAPLAEPKRAQRFFTIVSAAAVRSGINGKAGNAAFANLGMQQSLNRLSPFLATLLAQLHQQYGLDIDTTLRGLRVTLLQQTGDHAQLRIQYVLGGHPVDSVLPAIRIDGHWYLADYLRRAEASLSAGQ